MLIDCRDPDCCLSSSATGASCYMSSPLCTTVPDPMQMATETKGNSFFDRVAFLLGKVQKYARREEFNVRTSCVLRGQVVAKSNPYNASSSTFGVPAVRVSAQGTELVAGFTLSRLDEASPEQIGAFDLLVPHCPEGSAVTLTFGRSPFDFSKRRVAVSPRKV